MNNALIPDFTEETFRTLLKEETVITLFQPIISVKDQSVVGYEALSRGVTGSRIIPPSQLFSIARATGNSLEFDRLCRKKAIESFSAFNKENKECILSINIDSSILSVGRGSNHLLNTVKEYQIDPSSIIIEILESEVKDTAVLHEFVERYREHRFLIAIDDIGTGFSNLERVIELRPDVIKIDRFLIDGISSSYYRQEIVKSIISMSHGTGSVVIAEGVENEEDVIACLEYGADYMQGFYFSKPDLIENIKGPVLHKIESAADRFRDKMLSRIKAKRTRSLKYDLMIGEITGWLSGLDSSLFSDHLRKVVENYGEIECIYIINDKGIQVSETIFHKDVPAMGNKLFRPDRHGANQSYKNYFFNLKSGLNKFTSEPYISKASGRLCITISAAFETKENIQYVLCCDIIDERNSL